MSSLVGFAGSDQWEALIIARSPRIYESLHTGGNSGNFPLWWCRPYFLQSFACHNLSKVNIHLSEKVKLRPSCFSLTDRSCFRIRTIFSFIKNHALKNEKVFSVWINIDFSEDPKHTVRSIDEAASTMAGRNLLPLRSVNGKVIRTISPLTIVDFFQICNVIDIFFFIQKLESTAFSG